LTEPPFSRVLKERRSPQALSDHLKILIIRIRQRFDEIHGDGPAPKRQRRPRVNETFLQSGQSDHEFDRRAGFEAFPERPFLIDDAVDATGVRIHDDGSPGVTAERGEHRFPHFGVLAAQIIASNGRCAGAPNGGFQASQATLKGRLSSGPLAGAPALRHAARPGA